VITAGALAVAGAMVLGGCSPKGKKPVDLVTAEAAMVEASVAGRDRPWVASKQSNSSAHRGSRSK